MALKGYKVSNEQPTFRVKMFFHNLHTGITFIDPIFYMQHHCINQFALLFVPFLTKAKLIIV